MTITAEMVKNLRDMTGAGMMECKKALAETSGDLQKAVDVLRKAGIAKAEKRSDRAASQGRIEAYIHDARIGVLMEVNCETDFVAREADFTAFSEEVAAVALASGADSVEAVLAHAGSDGTVLEERRRALIAKIGENITVRRMQRISSSGVLGSYLHGMRIGAVVAIEGGDIALARDLAMHVAAINPAFVDASEVPAEHLAKEKEILVAQAAGEGKPAAIVEKMVEGRIRKFLAEITLVGQPFVKDPDTTVEKLLKQAGATVKSFARLEVGAGIEKKQENFADEVMATVKSSEKK